MHYIHYSIVNKYKSTATAMGKLSVSSAYVRNGVSNAQSIVLKN